MSQLIINVGTSNGAGDGEKVRDAFIKVNSMFTDAYAHSANLANPHAVTTAQIGAIPTTLLGASLGVATLDATGKLALVQIPTIPFATAAGNANVLTNPRTIVLAGGVTGSVAFDGSSNVTLAAGLAATGITPGTYGGVIVDSRGLVTGQAASAGSSATLTAQVFQASTAPAFTSTLGSAYLNNDGINIAARVGSMGAFIVQNVAGTGLGTLTAGVISAGTLTAGLFTTATIAAQVVSGATYTGGVTFANTINLAAYTETASSPAITAGTLTLDLGAGSLAQTTMSANVTTLTFLNVPVSGRVGTITLVLTANGTAYTFTWPASVRWPGATAPTLTQTTGKRDIFTLFTFDGGTSWNGVVVGQNF